MILIDFGVFQYKSIFTGLKLQKHAPWLCIKSILSCLKRIEFTEDDILIIAVDSPLGSWRKKVDGAYKANRADLRAKVKINWSEVFAEFQGLLEKLKKSTPFNIISLDNLEADDIIAYAVRFYKDQECVIISTDSDYEQLAQFDNVHLFSPISKKYKIVKNPELIVAQKVKREKTDNLISPILNQLDYDNRHKIVNLCKLPDEIEQLIESNLHFIQPKKDYDVSLFPFTTMLNDIQSMFNIENKFIVTYSDSLNKNIKKVTKKDIIGLEV